MRIKNLISFITKFGLRKTHNLSNTKVVIDGNNFFHSLYNQFSKQNPNDFLFGGNYTEYQSLFEEFFKNLFKCNITPIVVFNGGNKVDRKRRYTRKHNISKQLSDNPPILPLIKPKDVFIPRLFKKSFKSVAKRMKVVCFNIKMNMDIIGKIEMAKLANDLNCPLISNDGDFIVMNIKSGVISIDSLKWRNPKKWKKSKEYYTKCEVLNVEDLIEYYYCDITTLKTKETFPLKLKAEMLPIFCSLMSMNDRSIYGLFEKSKILPLITHEWSGSVKNKKIDQLFCWLALRETKEAIYEIESHFNPNQNSLQQFRDSLKSYDTNGKSYLKELLDNKLMEMNEDFNIDANLNESQLQRSKSIDSQIETRIDYLKPLIEDFSLESIYESSIRLKGFHLGLLRTNRNDETPVRIIMRKGHSFEEGVLIYPETRISGTFDGDKQLPIMSEINDLSDIVRKNHLFAILKFKEQWMTDLEADLISIGIESEDIEFWKYFLIVITFWKSNSKMDESNKLQYIQAFVQKLIYFRHNSLISDDFNAMTSVEFCSGQQFKPFVIHYYCEIQRIYTSIKRLVKILDVPITASKVYHYFNGILLYNLFNQITANPNNSSPFKDDKLNTIYNIIIDSILKTNKH